MESRRDNWIVAGLVLAGLLLIATIVTHGFRGEAAVSSQGASGGGRADRAPHGSRPLRRRDPHAPASACMKRCTTRSFPAARCSARSAR